jgi:hypothetical protein
MKWTDQSIARHLATVFFNRQYLCVVNNCSWTGNECDLLVVTENLRVIDVEIKISRADLKADAKKAKWVERKFIGYGGTREAQYDVIANAYPPKVWKHYYCMPAEIWTPELFACLPSTCSGVVLLTDYEGIIQHRVERRAKPDTKADKISPAAAIDIARLASLRMWDSYKSLEQRQAA